jgi:L,D-peptidoglycan transpeptidase YkuD (ErfK/YbiS/YcfS/YnhG family)
MMEAVRTSETSVDNHSTRQYNPEDSSEHHTRHRENLKSDIRFKAFAATKFNKILLGFSYPEDEDGDGSRNVGFIHF